MNLGVLLRIARDGFFYTLAGITCCLLLAILLARPLRVSTVMRSSCWLSRAISSPFCESLSNCAEAIEL
jgi:hypothetical protein